MNKDNLSELGGRYLGQQGSYAVEDINFNPNYLIPMGRDLVRKSRQINIDLGVDVWHCRESTFLLKNGSPITGTLKIIYPASSKYMIESKSFKLYLNSFDMCKMGDSIKEAILNYETQITQDLKYILEDTVSVKFFREGLESIREFPGEGYIQIERLVNIEDLIISNYKVDSKLLKSKGSILESSILKLYTSSLRSRCRYTKQKDTGSAYIEIHFNNYKTISIKSLFRYLVSYRMEDEFHEFCAEQIYTDLKKLPGVSDLSVMLLYSRRGSLDINPIRYSSLNLFNKPLECLNINTIKTENQ